MECFLKKLFRKIGNWVKGAVKTVAKAVVNVAKAVVNTVVRVGKNIVNQVKNATLAVVNTAVGVGKGIASGVMLMAGNKAASAKLAAEAQGSLKKAVNNVVSYVKSGLDTLGSAGDLYRSVTKEMNNVVPYWGTVWDIGLGFTPAGPYLAAAKAAADVNNVVKNGGNVGQIASAVGFGVLDVGLSKLGRAGDAMKVAKAKHAGFALMDKMKAAELANGPLYKRALGEAKGRVTTLVDKVKGPTLDSWNYTKVTKREIAQANKLLLNSPKKTKALEIAGYIAIPNKVVRGQDFIPGRERDKDDKLTGKGGSEWENRMKKLKPLAKKPAPNATAGTSKKRTDSTAGTSQKLAAGTTAKTGRSKSPTRSANGDGSQGDGSEGSSGGLAGGSSGGSSGGGGATPSNQKSRSSFLGIAQNQLSPKRLSPLKSRHRL